jgi:hypothetical protein
MDYIPAVSKISHRGRSQQNVNDQFEVAGRRCGCLGASGITFRKTAEPAGVSCRIDISLSPQKARSSATVARAVLRQMCASSLVLDAVPGGLELHHWVSRDMLQDIDPWLDSSDESHVGLERDSLRDFPSQTLCLSLTSNSLSAIILYAGRRCERS